MEIIQKVSKGIVLNGTFFIINATFQQESEISLQLCNVKCLLKTFDFVARMKLFCANFCHKWEQELDSIKLCKKLAYSWGTLFCGLKFFSTSQKRNQVVFDIKFFSVELLTKWLFYNLHCRKIHFCFTPKLTKKCIDTET